MINKTRHVIRIVDDDAFIRESFCYLLEGEGWRTKAYASAEEFLEEDDVSVTGCIVLDVRMPGGMTGLELQQELLRCSCGLPLIFVSAHGNIEMAVPFRTARATSSRNPSTRRNSLPRSKRPWRSARRTTMHAPTEKNRRRAGMRSRSARKKWPPALRRGCPTR